MSQQKFNPQPGDPVATICNNNFDELYANSALALASGTPFRVTGTLTAAAAATAIHLVPAASVTGTKKVYVTGVYFNVGGATAWTDVTATKVQIQDTAGTPIVGQTWAKALLTGNSVNSNSNASTSLSAMAVGFTAAKGLDFVADANFAAGSTINIIVYGYIA